jgi:DNA polymerase
MSDIRATYRGAKRRCTDPKCKDYEYYGGRGIEFKFSSPEELLAEIGPKPTSEHSIDRIDSNGHYAPGNVRWATAFEQVHNRRKMGWGMTHTVVYKALKLRKQLAKSSLSKLDALIARTAQDGQLRHSYRFYGAHTGRFSGEGVQLQNLVRGSIKDVDAATECIKTSEDVDNLRQFGPPLEVISSCLRSAFCAPEGKQFVVCDLSQIELRVLAWITGCKDMMYAFCKGADLYVEFAANEMYNKPADQVTKHERQIAKSAVLGAGYGIGGGEKKLDKNGDEFKSGLWGYSEALQVEMSQEEAHEAVAAFRAAYPEIPMFWRHIGDAAIDAVGNNKMIEFGRLIIGGTHKKILWIQLPSGRRLHYVRAQVESDGTRSQLVYEGQFMGGWGIRRTWGGIFTENIVQAIARDVLAEGMLRAHEAGLVIVAHCHDELVCECDADKAQDSLALLEKCMTDPIDWASGLLLKAEGFVSERYKK